MEPFTSGNPLQKQLEELKLHMNQMLEEKKVVTEELTKSENAINELMEEIMNLQKRFKESVKDPSEKQDLLTNGDQKGIVCSKPEDEHQKELQRDLCRLQEDIPNMEQCLKNLRRYLDLSETQRLRLMAVKDKFLRDGGPCDTENEDPSLPPALRRPNMELLNYKIGLNGFPRSEDTEGESFSRSSLGTSVSTAVVTRCKVSNEQSSKVNEDLSLTDCQKMIHHQNITIDDLTSQVYKQKYTISQLTKDLHHLRFLHQQILQMEQTQRSQEMKVLGLERQNDLYYISIIKLMEKNDELQKKLSNEQESIPNVSDNKSVVAISKALEHDHLSEKFTQTADGGNDDINQAIEDFDQEDILNNLSRNDVQLNVMISMIYRQNDRIVLLEQEKKEDENKIDTLKTEIDHLTKKNGEVTTHFENLTHTVQSLNGLNDKLNGELFQMQEVQTLAANEKLQQLQRENDALVKERDEAVASNNDLVMKYDNLKNRIAPFRPIAHSRKVRRLKIRMVKMKFNIRKHKALSKKLTDRVSELQSKCEMLMSNYVKVILEGIKILSQRDQLQSLLDTLLSEKEELEMRLNKRNQAICACCLKLNRELIALKSAFQQLQNERDLSKEDSTSLIKDVVEVQTKLDEANEQSRATTEQLEAVKEAHDELLKYKFEFQNKLRYLDYKYKRTIDKLGKDKSALQSDFNALEEKYVNLSDLSQKESLDLQSKVLELATRYSNQEQTLQAKMVELKEQSDMIQQLTTDLEEQSIQLELFQENNILYKQKIDSIYGEREIVERQLQKTVKHLKRSELRYLSVRKLLVDIESHVAGDSNENSDIFDLKISLKNCQDELLEVEDKLTDSLSAAKCLDEEVANIGENQQKLNRCIIVLVTTWRGVLERVMNVQVLLDQLAAINLKSFASLDKTFCQLHEQTCLTIEILGTLSAIKLSANGTEEYSTLPHSKYLQQ